MGAPGHRASDSQGSELAAPEHSDSRNPRAARQTRTRKPKRRYEDDSPPPPAPAPGAVHFSATSRARDDDDVLAAKRARGATGASVGLASVPPAATTALGEMQAPQQALINLRTQFENIMKALKDPGSLVNNIFTRAQQRLHAMISDAGLDVNFEKDHAVYNLSLIHI